MKNCKCLQNVLHSIKLSKVDDAGGRFVCTTCAPLLFAEECAAGGASVLSHRVYEKVVERHMYMLERNTPDEGAQARSLMLLPPCRETSSHAFGQLTTQRCLLSHQPRRTCRPQSPVSHRALHLPVGCRTPELRSLRVTSGHQPRSRQHSQC